LSDTTSQARRPQTKGEAQQQAALEARCGIEQPPYFLGTEHERDLLRLGDVLDLVGDLRPS
jgi:hypothetical protein